MALVLILFGGVRTDKVEDSKIAISEKIREYYDKEAKEWLLDSRSTINDQNERRLEVKTLLRHIQENEQVLDVGCGNGYTAIQIAKKYKGKCVGIDFSYKMIEVSNRQKEYNKNRLKGQVSFETASVLDLPFPDQTFDKIVSERCLINLTSGEEQKRGILEINRVLKYHGVFLMLESYLEGLTVINSLRRKLGLTDIPVKWFNLYFEESKLREFIKPYFKLIKIEYFNSSYYLFTRVLYPALLKRFNKEPSFESKMNYALSFLPNFGKFGYIRLYIFKKI